jgi:hypothetical protein
VRLEGLLARASHPQWEGVPESAALGLVVCCKMLLRSDKMLSLRATETTKNSYSFEANNRHLIVLRKG